MCALGYTIAGSETNTFWAADLLHRLFHMPSFGQNWIDHFADGYEEVVDQVLENATLSTHDSETLQYFALEVYAYDIAVPGEGCPGKPHTHDDKEKSSQSTATGTTTTAEAPSTTDDVPKVSDNSSK
jgi:activator of HSP90 ATPase